MDEFEEKYLDSLPKFEGRRMTECFKLDRMQRFCYEMISPTPHANQDDIDAMRLNIESIRRKGCPYVVTAEIKKLDIIYRLWVPGVEKRVVNSEINKSTRLNGVPA